MRFAQHKLCEATPCKIARPAELAGLAMTEKCASTLPFPVYPYRKIEQRKRYSPPHLKKPENMAEIFPASLLSLVYYVIKNTIKIFYESFNFPVINCSLDRKNNSP